jgi:HEAT repeat protein
MPALFLLLLLAQSDPRITFLSRQLTQAKDPRARAQAALLLGTTGEPGALGALCGALDDPSELVRSASARALGTLEDTSALECLHRHAHDPVPEVQASLERAVKGLEEVAKRPPSLYVAVAPLEEASPALPPDLRLMLAERLRLKLTKMGVRLAPAAETKPQARAALKALGVKGFLLRPEAEPQASGALKLRLLCLTYPDKAILGEVSVQASGAPPPDLIRALVPKALDEAAETFDWRQ